MCGLLSAPFEERPRWLVRAYSTRAWHATAWLEALAAGAEAEVSDLNMQEPQMLALVARVAIEINQKLLERNFHPLDHPLDLCALVAHVESRRGAPTLGSGGFSAAFAVGLSPAPVATFPLPAHRTGRADLPHPALRLVSPRSARTASHGFIRASRRHLVTTLLLRCKIELPLKRPDLRESFQAHANLQILGLFGCTQK